MTENNNIPPHWQSKKLGEVCKVVTGTTPSKNNQDFYGTQYPFYKPTDLEQGINTIYARDGLTKSGLENGRFLPKDSVLVTCIGATIGKAGLIRKEGSCNQQINAILPNKYFHPAFLYYQIISEGFQRLIKSNAASTTLPILNKSKFENLRIVIPPLPEQLTIVSKIEELFSALDNGKQQLETAQQQLKVYRQSLLKAAFEGKLTGTKNWTNSTLGEICDMKAGFFVKASEIQNEFTSGLFPCYGGNGLRGYTKSHTHEGKFSLVGRQGALCGNVHLVSGRFHATEHAVVTTAKANIDTDWLFYKLTSMKLNQYSRGAAQPGLSVNKLLPLEVQVPQIQDQQKIVSELESKLTVCNKLEETITHALQQAETLRQSILKKAFEGKLVTMPYAQTEEPLSLAAEQRNVYSKKTKNT